MMIWLVDGERIGDQADQIADQDEEEDAEHQREEAHPVLARRRAHHAGDELVAHFGQRLQAAGDAGAAARPDRRDQAGQRHREQHIEPGIRQRKIDVCDRNREDSDEWKIAQSD